MQGETIKIISDSLQTCD